MREGQRLTRRDLAHRLGVSVQRIQALEGPTSNPTIATLSHIAQALGCDLNIRIGSLSVPADPISHK